MIQSGCRCGAILAFLAASHMFGQTRIDLRSQGRNVDFADAPVTRPFTVGTSLPANCSPGTAFFKSDAEAGRNLYLCTATNVWTLTSSDHSVVTVATLPPVGANTGKVFVVSDAADKSDCTSGGGFTFTACVSDGSVWSPVAGAKAPFVQAFTTPATVWTASGASHGLGTQIEVFVQTDDGTNWRRADPSDVSINKATGDVVVNWASGTVGRMMITNLAGAGSGGGGGGTNDHSQLQNLDYANSGHTGFAPAQHASQHRHGGSDEVATSAPLAHGIPKAGATGQLDRNWLPVMQGDTGSGGALGAVPAPQTGDAAKCLKGNGTWGDCGGSGAGDNIMVNSAPVTGANFNSITPAAPANARHVLWLADASSPANIAAYVPVMTGDQGVGGEAGLVPTPAAGDASKCLKGDGTWGSCGTASGGSLTIQDESVTLTQRETLNFTGSGVTCVDDAAHNRTSCSIPGGAGGSFDPATTYDMSGLNKVNLQYASIYLANNGTSGTALYRTACLASNGTATQCGTANAGRTLGVCMQGCGTTGNARIAVLGHMTCEFDGGVSAGNWVTVSTISAGRCTDGGASKPATALGIALVTQSGAGNYDLIRGIQ